MREVQPLSLLWPPEVQLALVMLWVQLLFVPMIQVQLLSVPWMMLLLLLFLLLL